MNYYFKGNTLLVLIEQHENSFLCSHLQLEDIEKMVEQKKIFKHFKPVTLFDWFWNILNVSL
jgi:hypothetical protein